MCKNSTIVEFCAVFFFTVLKKLYSDKAYLSSSLNDSKKGHKSESSSIDKCEFFASRLLAGYSEKRSAFRMQRRENPRKWYVLLVALLFLSVLRSVPRWISDSSTSMKVFWLENIVLSSEKFLMVLYTRCLEWTV